MEKSKFLDNYIILQLPANENFLLLFFHNPLTMTVTVGRRGKKMRERVREWERER